MAALDSATLVTADQSERMANATDAAAADPSSAGIIDRVQEGLKRAAEKVDSEFSKNEARMHRYPAVFRGLMRKDDSYFVPRCVAIGPYHHRAAHLQRAEEVKRAAAYFCIRNCEASGHSAEAVYARILSVAGHARSCYDHDAVAGISQADFATMMLQDGCFLLQYIIHRTVDAAWPSLRCWFFANLEGIHRDIFLLENQVPWLVLDALMSMMPPHVDVGKFISGSASSFEAQLSTVGDDTSCALVLKGSYKPAHLLDLLHHFQSGRSSDVSTLGQSTALSLPNSDRGKITSLPSAVDLAEIGIQLTNSRTARFRDMGLGKGLFFYKLFLAPLVMDDENACWLLNMVAFEIATRPRDSTVRSYVLLLAMLMKREEDVHELRVKRILHGKFSDQRALSFLQDLVDQSFLTQEHATLMADLEGYRRKRWMWISLHKFIYNNFKCIVAVLPIIGITLLLFTKQH